MQATLTLNGNPSYVQDSTGSAEVDGISTQGLKIGDEVLVTGEPLDTENGLLFHHSSVEFLWDGSPIPPLSVTADDAALGKFAGMLIEVSGRFLATESHGGETWLRLESGNQAFLAHITSERGSSLLPPIESGSTIRLRGVCSLQPSDTHYLGGFAILLRSAEDVAIISGPPWWSFRHLVELGILLASIVLAAHISLIQMLKARVRAIMAERARLGHELHDTLAQSFAGLAFQIQAAQRIVPRSSSLLTQHLDIALDMVRHSHAEAHRSIMMLRPQHLEEGADLPAAIQSALDQSTAGCHLKASLSISGSVERLPLVTTDTLYRIAQEAIANALRHGQPAVLEVRLDYKPSSVLLSVVDDGVGFEMKSQQHRGFGLAGMRERAHALRGEFSVTSEPGRGTKVNAEFFLRRDAGAHFISLVSKLPSLYWGRLQHIVQGNRPGSSRQVAKPPVAD
jgi:signal transduction histidine kinase